MAKLIQTVNSVTGFSNNDTNFVLVEFHILAVIFTPWIISTSHCLGKVRSAMATSYTFYFPIHCTSTTVFSLLTALYLPQSFSHITDPDYQ